MDLSNDQGVASARTLEILSHSGPRYAERGAEAVDLSALWTELVSGSCKIEETLFTQQSCALVVTRGHRSAGKGGALSRRHAEILERSLIEGARKSVAIDLGLCPSSVAEILKQGFGFMGLSCWPSRIPLLLVLAAHAQRAREFDVSHPPTACASGVAAGNRVCSRSDCSGRARMRRERGVE